MDEKSESKIVVKVICVLLSFSLWLYVINSENPSRTSVIKDVSVDILNEDVLKSLGLTLSPNQEFVIDLNIEGPTTEVYSIKKEDFSLSVDLSDYALKAGENNVPVKLVDYPNSINVKSDNVLSIKIKIEDLIEKEVDLRSNVDVSFRNGFSLSSKEVNPSKVIVSGPKSMVDKVNHAELNGTITDVSEDLDEEFDIWAVDSAGSKVSDVTLNKEKGKLKINVIQGKEANVKVNYKGELPKGITISKEELENKTVSIKGENSVINNITTIETEEIDLSSVTKSGNYTVKLKVPEGVTIVSNTETVVVNLTLDGEITKVINDVPITFNDFDNDKFTILDPVLINVTISGNINEVNKITKDDIEINASLLDISEPGSYNINWTATCKNTNVIVVNKQGSASLVLKEK